MFNDQSAISAHYDTAHTQSSSRGRPEQRDSRYECEVCGRKFTENGNLTKHLSTIHGVGDVKTFQCNICDRTFTQKGNLKAHLAAVHSVDDVKTFQCDIALGCSGARITLGAILKVYIKYNFGMANFIITVYKAFCSV